MNKYSLYSETKVKGQYRDYYGPIDIPYSESDFILIVSSEYKHKPGALAQMLYGTPRLSWIFSYYNPNILNDNIFDLEEGIILRLPSKERLLSYF